MIDRSARPVGTLLRMRRLAGAAALGLALVGGLAAPGLANREAPEAVAASAQLLAYLKGVEVKAPEVHGGLALYPLVSRQDFALEKYLTLDEALKRKVLVVTELKGGAEVNSLTLENTGDRPIFVMTGEIMQGAKQDRTMQNDLLIPPKSGKMKVSVFCTEHGRWVENTKSFEASEQAVPNSVRAAAKVDKQQSRVWDSIAENQSRLKASAPTQAAKDVYQNKEVQRDLKPYINHLSGLTKRQAHVVGVVAFYGGRLVAVDLFGDDALFARLYPKLLRSYVVDVINEKAAGTKGIKDAQALLSRARTGQWIRHATEGAGTALALEQKALHGSALLDGAMTLHADMFEGEAAPPSDDVRNVPNMNIQQRRNR